MGTLTTCTQCSFALHLVHKPGCQERSPNNSGAPSMGTHCLFIGRPSPGTRLHLLCQKQCSHSKQLEELLCLRSCPFSERMHCTSQWSPGLGGNFHITSKFFLLYLNYM